MEQTQEAREAGLMPLDAKEALLTEFTKCLGTMSHSRAGWDYELPREQRDRENREEADALQRVRTIWRGNPDMQTDLRAAFKAASPLATMAEIEYIPGREGPK